MDFARQNLFDIQIETLDRKERSTLSTLTKTSHTMTEKLKFSSHNGVIEAANWPIYCLTRC